MVAETRGLIGCFLLLYTAVVMYRTCPWWEQFCKIFLRRKLVYPNLGSEIVANLFSTWKEGKPIGANVRKISRTSLGLSTRQISHYKNLVLNGYLDNWT